jgi:hypothetical protein
MWQLARAWTSVPSLRIVAAPLLSTFFVSRIPYCAIILFSRSAIGCAAGLAIACSGHGSLSGSLGLAESGAELPAGLAKSGAPSVFGSPLIAPALAHTPAKPRKSLLIPGSAWSHDVFFLTPFAYRLALATLIQRHMLTYGIGLAGEAHCSQSRRVPLGPAAGASAHAAAYGSIECARHS